MSTASPQPTAPAPPAPAGGPSERRGGRLAAVVGLGGGVGTSLLAQLLATSGARSGGGPVLLADAGGPGAVLALRCGEQAPLSLGDAAEALARGWLDRRPFAELEQGLRLLAREPQLDEGDRREGLEQLLEQAARAHRLGFVDCGTLQRPIEQQALAGCETVVWVAELAEAALGRAATTLAAFAPLAPRRQILAVFDRGAGRAAERRASELGERCGLPVALLEAIDGAREEQLDRGLAQLAPQLTAIAGALR